MAEKMKRCSGCKEEKPVGEYYKNRSREDGLSDRCKECDRGSTGRSLRKRRGSRLLRDMRLVYERGEEDWKTEGQKALGKWFRSKPAEYLNRMAAWERAEGEEQGDEGGGEKGPLVLQVDEGEKRVRELIEELLDGAEIGKGAENG
jgi:hypothetical protein